MSFADIQVIDVDPITRRVVFGVKPKRITGVSKLIQIVVLSLMTVPGRDVLDPEKGGGLPAMIGMNIDPNDSTEVFAEIAQRVKKSQAEIVAAQIGLDEDPEAKLQDLQIVSIQKGETPDEVLVRIRVINEAGRASDIVV
jgi:hypothetical protein